MPSGDSFVSNFYNLDWSSNSWPIDTNNQLQATDHAGNTDNQALDRPYNTSLQVPAADAPSLQLSQASATSHYPAAQLPEESTPASYDDYASHATQEPIPVALPSAFHALTTWQAKGSARSAVAVQIPDDGQASNLIVPTNPSGIYTYYVTGPFPGMPNIDGQGLPPLQAGVQTAAAFVIRLSASNIDATQASHPANAHSAVDIDPMPELMASNIDALPQVLGIDEVYAPGLFSAQGIGPVRTQHSPADRFTPYGSRAPSVHSREHTTSFQINMADFMDSLRVPNVNPLATGQQGASTSQQEALLVPSMLVPSNAPIVGTSDVLQTIADHYCVAIMTSGPIYPNQLKSHDLIVDATLRAKLSLSIEGNRVKLSSTEMRLFKDSWPDLIKELRAHIEKTGEGYYGLDKARSPNERTTFANYMKGNHLGFLCVHIPHITQTINHKVFWDYLGYFVFGTSRKLGAYVSLFGGRHSLICAAIVMTELHFFFCGFATGKFERHVPSKADYLKVFKDFLQLLKGMERHVYHRKILVGSMIDCFRNSCAQYCPEKYIDAIQSYVAPAPADVVYKLAGPHLLHSQTAINFHIDEQAKSRQITVNEPLTA